MVMLIYSTKYALTLGIAKLEASTTSVPDMVRVGLPGIHCLHGEGREWHRTWASALARAEQMRKAKLASLRKSIAKLESLQFKEPTA
jgi:hypothetical protein